MTYTNGPGVPRVDWFAFRASDYTTTPDQSLNVTTLRFPAGKIIFAFVFGIISVMVLMRSRYRGIDIPLLKARHELAINKCAVLLSQKYKRVHIEYDRIVSRILDKYTPKLPIPKRNKEQRHGSVIKLCGQYAMKYGIANVNRQ